MSAVNEYIYLARLPDEGAIAGTALVRVGQIACSLLYVIPPVHLVFVVAPGFLDGSRHLSLPRKPPIAGRVIGQ
jgi:hypothetical protein